MSARGPKEPELRAFLLIALATAVARADADDDAMGGRVQALLRAHQADVYGCVAAEPGAARGDILFRIFVDDERHVGRADVLKQTTPSTTVAACLKARMTSWDLTPLGAGPGDQIVFPLSFAPTQPTALERRTLDGKRTENLPNRPQLGVFAVDGGVSISLGPKRPFTALAARDLAWLPSVTGATLRGRGRVVLIHGYVPAAGEPRIIHAGDVKPWPILDGKGAASLYLDPPLGIAIDVISADRAVIAPHRHADSDELVYVVDGSCASLNAGRAQNLTVGEGLVISAGDEHSMRSDGKLVVLQVYTPSGPEQRFKR